jgi:hypothetical protein
MLTVLKSIIGSLFMSYLKKNAAHLIVEALIEVSERGAKLTGTKWDDNRVAEMKRDQPHYEDILRNKIDHLI